MWTTGYGLEDRTWAKLKQFMRVVKESSVEYACWRPLDFLKWREDERGVLVHTRWHNAWESPGIAYAVLRLGADRTYVAMTALVARSCASRRMWFVALDTHCCIQSAILLL